MSAHWVLTERLAGPPSMLNLDNVVAVTPIASDEGRWYGSVQSVSGTLNLMIGPGHDDEEEFTEWAAHFLGARGDAQPARSDNPPASKPAAKR